MYARGGTGQDMTVALVDSGLNAHLQEFEGRLADPGYDYVEDRPGTVDRIGHGTQMAGILAANKDNQGMHGIAFNARLIPFRFGDDNEPFFFDSEIARSWQSGFDKGARLFNNSWANAIPATEITESRYNQVMPDSLGVARRLVSEGAVFVFPTGNELKREPLAEPGLPAALPELEKGWIAVVALKNDGSAINGKSNYCGLRQPGASPFPVGTQVLRQACSPLPGMDVTYTPPAPLRQPRWSPAHWLRCRAVIHNSVRSRYVSTCWRQAIARVSTPTARPMGEA